MSFSQNQQKKNLFLYECKCQILNLTYFNYIRYTLFSTFCSKLQLWKLIILKNFKISQSYTECVFLFAYYLCDKKEMLFQLLLHRFFLEDCIY